MPPGKKAPPQQSSLSEFWGSKQKKGVAAAAAPPDKDKSVVDGHHPPETDSATEAWQSSERALLFIYRVRVPLMVLISQQLRRQRNANRHPSQSLLPVVVVLTVVSPTRVYLV